MEKFYLDAHLSKSDVQTEENRHFDFAALCTRVKEDFFEELSGQKENLISAMDIQKKAIIGYENEVSYFKEKIRARVQLYGAKDTPFPPWYETLTEAIYHENWGMAGIAQWFSKEFQSSSSAKIIGDRIYFLEEGHMVQKPQKIEKARREQLIRAFLLLTPAERLDQEVHEIYLLDGTRVTVFGGDMTKPGEDVIVFRRYIVPNYRFEEQVARGTIPKEAISLFRPMVKLGYNISFTGAVRTAKTTFLSTWQSYEDSALEGVMVETDPEIPLHKLMPSAPIIQLLADDDKLGHVTKSLLRSDADYFILAEARDGVALDTAVRIAAKGTRRMKMTFHTREPLSFPLDVALEIIKERGGDLEVTMRKVASSFDYVFHFVQLKNKSQKRLKSIYELGLDRETGRIAMTPICLYDYKTDGWQFFYHISRDKRRLGTEEDQEAFAAFEATLKVLAQGMKPQRTVEGEAERNQELKGKPAKKAERRRKK